MHKGHAVLFQFEATAPFVHGVCRYFVLFSILIGRIKPWLPKEKITQTWVGWDAWFVDGVAVLPSCAAIVPDLPTAFIHRPPEAV